MKLIVTADDYGITDAVTDGICKCARLGVLTQTGLFTNMPGSEYAAKRMINEYPHICLGQDINLVAGNPVTDPKLIPTLVQEDGSFRTSSMHRKLDQTQPNHIKYEEAYLETENQVKRFIDLTGKKPAYLSGHSYGTVETERAIKDVAQKYEVVLSMDMYKKIGVAAGLETAEWNKVVVKSDGKYDFGMDVQFSRDPLKLFKEGKLDYLEKALKENGVAHIHTHAGFADKDLFDLSSFTLIRIMEANFITSKELVDWVKVNNVELVSINDLK